MPHNILKLMMALLVAGLALTACGPSNGDGAGGDASTEQAEPTDDTTTN